MALDSRNVKPNILAAVKHGKNLEKKATVQISTTYPQVTPLLSKPRFVRKPERVKYWSGQVH